MAWTNVDFSSMGFLWNSLDNNFAGLPYHDVSQINLLVTRWNVKFSKHVPWLGLQYIQVQSVRSTAFNAGGHLGLIYCYFNTGAKWNHPSFLVPIRPPNISLVVIMSYVRILKPKWNSAVSAYFSESRSHRNHHNVDITFASVPTV